MRARRACGPGAHDDNVVAGHRRIMSVSHIPGVNGLTPRMDTAVSVERRTATAHATLLAVVVVWASAFSVIKALLDHGFVAEDIATATVTTRDVDRGDAPHFLLKEIIESPRSMRKRASLIRTMSSTPWASSLAGSGMLPNSGIPG